MENKQFSDQPENTDWLDELLTEPSLSNEIGPDEHAVSSAGLSDLRDLELERIMQEALSDDWITDEPAEPEPPAVPEDTDEAVYTDTADATDTADQVPVDPNAPVRKVRPRRKKGYGLFGIPHLLSAGIWLILAVAIGVSLGRLLWVCAADILAFGRENQTVYITITDTDDIDSVTEKLYNTGLIKYPRLFKMYADLSGAEEDISVGTFMLNTMYDYHALVGGMSETSSYRETIEVMIPEGYTCAQIFALLEDKGVCTAAELEEYASQSEFADYWFLDGMERGSKYCLEGFLFPDTYEFYTNDTPKRVFIKLLDRFDNQFSEELQAHLITLNETLSNMLRANGYDQSFIDDNQMDLYDVIKVASMIQKESAHTGENYDISSVIYNRLTNQREFRCLQIDATIVYALGSKADLTEEDLKLDSPYNSYLYPGLPPTPISNPGLSCILAALSPADTDYYYYALDPSAGEHHFSKTYDEHLKFLNSLE